MVACLISVVRRRDGEMVLFVYSSTYAQHHYGCAATPIGTFNHYPSDVYMCVREAQDPSLEIIPQDPVAPRYADP